MNITIVMIQNANKKSIASNIIKITENDKRKPTSIVYINLDYIKYIDFTNHKTEYVLEKDFDIFSNNFRSVPQTKTIVLDKPDVGLWLADGSKITISYDDFEKFVEPYLNNEAQ